MTPDNGRLRGEEMNRLRMKNGRDRMRLLALFCLTCCLMGFGAKAASGQQAKGKTVAASPDQQLKLGFFYYNNDDISDKAAAQFRLAANSRDPATAETAQYYLGSYFQRKYYVQQANYGKADRKALETAVLEYRAYTTKYYKTGSHQWLADAFFNLALVYLQLGDARNAGFELNKLREAKALDDSVYIYQVIYSQSRNDVLDAFFPSGPLADYTSALLSAGQPFDQQIAAIKNWCRQQVKR